MEDLVLPPIHETGFVNALKRYAEGVGRRYGIKVHLKIQKDVSGLGNEKEILVFRIIQEALNNIVKHAHAKNAWVDMGQIQQMIILAIRDDGKGFSLKRKKKANYGLYYMRERTNMLDGRFAIESTINKGTKILISIPIG